MFFISQETHDIIKLAYRETLGVPMNLYCQKTLHQVQTINTNRPEWLYNTGKCSPNTRDQWFGNNGIELFGAEVCLLVQIGSTLHLSASQIRGFRVRTCSTRVIHIGNRSWGVESSFVWQSRELLFKTALWLACTHHRWQA